MITALWKAPDIDSVASNHTMRQAGQLCWRANGVQHAGCSARQRTRTSTPTLRIGHAELQSQQRRPQQVRCLSHQHTLA